MFRVKGACVVVTSGGMRQEMYPPAPLPDDVPQSEIDHLLDVDLIEEVEDLTAPPPPGAVGWPAPVEEGAQAPANTLSVEEAEAVEAQSDGSGLPSDAPRGNASEAAWRSYAVSRGVDQEKAATMSRDELKAEVAKLS